MDGAIIAGGPGFHKVWAEKVMRNKPERDTYPRPLCQSVPPSSFPA